MLSESTSVKAASKTLVKLTPGKKGLLKISPYPNTKSLLPHSFWQSDFFTPQNYSLLFWDLKHVATSVLTNWFLAFLLTLKNSSLIVLLRL